MNIDFNNKDLKNLTDDQKQLLQSLVDKIEGWPKANGIDPDYKNHELTNEEAAKFVKWLQDTITSEASFLPKSGDKLILYSGNTSTGNPLWRELKEGDFLKNNPDFYYISDTDPGAILWKEPYETAITNALGSSELKNQVLYGQKFNEVTGKYERFGNCAVDGYDLLAMDDFVSESLTKAAIDRGFSVTYVAGYGVVGTTGANLKVGITTEIPCALTEKWMGKTVDEALKTKFTAVDDLNKLTVIDTLVSEILGRNTRF